MPTFADVKTILDALVDGADWDAVVFIHSCDGTKTEHPIGWREKDDLVQAEVWMLENNEPVRYRLIDPALVGNNRGSETYLVQALTRGALRQDGSGRRYPQMPFNMDKATPQQIQTIIAWIDAGMP